VVGFRPPLEEISKIAITQTRIARLRWSLAGWCIMGPRRSCTGFCTVTKTNKCFSWVVQIRAKQIQDDGPAPCWKMENRPYLRKGPSDRHQIWHVDAHWPSKQVHQLKISTFKNPRWWTRHLEKLKNGHVPATVRPTITKFGLVMHNGPPSGTGSLDFELFKIQNGRRSPFWKSENGHISATVHAINTKLVTCWLATYRRK